MDEHQKYVIAGLNALSAKYPNDLIFANAGFATGVVHCIVDAVLMAQGRPSSAIANNCRFPDAISPEPPENAQ